MKLTSKIEKYVDLYDSQLVVVTANTEALTLTTTIGGVLVREQQARYRAQLQRWWDDELWGCQASKVA